MVEFFGFFFSCILCYVGSCFRMSKIRMGVRYSNEHVQEEGQSQCNQEEGLTNHDERSHVTNHEKQSSLFPNDSNAMSGRAS